MTIIGIYPRRDRAYQQYYIRQVIISKNRISHFPLLDKIMDNFRGYEDLRWKESINKVFLETTISPDRMWIPEDIRLEIQSKNQKQASEKEIKDPIFDRNKGDFPNSSFKLEDAIKLFIDFEGKKKQFKEFKQRITSLDYHVSDSAVSEIVTAYDFVERIGFDNVELNPAINSGKNGDIKVTVNGHEIFFELTSPREKESERKIQRIFDDFAGYLGKRNWNKNFNFIIWVNTLSFPLDEDEYIDEVKSKNMLRLKADNLFFDKLVGCNVLINLDYEFYSINGEEYLSQLVDNNPFFIHDGEFLKNIKKQPQLREWSESVKLKDLNSSPFHSIGCATGGDGVFVEIHGNISYPSDVGQVEEESFFNKIRKAISEKIKKEQYEKGKPAIILLKTSLWSNWYESDESDFLKIKSVIQNELEKTPYLSGVIIYSSDFRNGRFIENKNAIDGSTIDKKDLVKLGLKSVS